jgi:tripeptidyl-peptidase-1
LLHAAAEAGSASYHDITQGNNAFGKCAGFNATVGWDPMTGWGTPNFPELVKHFIDAH